uniref:biotin--[acetyl-CoA-carboxylase] ligase n=1 Tax=uncultured Draconibacterium sp. TaxID=1573823 RepID=UPI0032162319
MFLTDKNTIVLNEVDSTNNYAKQLIADKAVEGTVVLAHYQKRGKGQEGNFWESEANKNLLFSLILYPGFLDAGKQFFISKIVSLALVEVLKKEIKEVHIKWPNDIYVGNKKIAGILIENTIKGSWLDSTIIGIGLNLNQECFKSDAPNPVSLKQLTGKEYLVQVVLTEFFNCFNLLMDELMNGNFEMINKAYMAQLFRQKQWSLFRKDGNEFVARIVGIGEFGQLQLQKKSGEISEFLFKEVEFVI